MEALGVGKILASKDPNLKVGEVVTSMLTWSDYTVTKQNAGVPIRALPPNVKPEYALSMLGLTGLTAWVGLIGLGKPQPGEIVLVSTAAGAVGNVAGQLAKNAGCTVIGITSSEEKQKVLKNLGFDHTINYRTDNLEQKIREFAPNGFDLYYDNVGDYQLQAALNTIKKKGRIILCGAAATYRAGKQGRSEMDLFPIILKDLSLQGFVLFDYPNLVGEAMKDMGQQLADGKLKALIDLKHGFENVPAVFGSMWRSENVGKLMLQLDAKL